MHPGVGSKEDIDGIARVNVAKVGFLVVGDDIPGRIVYQAEKGLALGHILTNLGVEIGDIAIKRRPHRAVFDLQLGFTHLGLSCLDARIGVSIHGESGFCGIAGLPGDLDGMATAFNLGLRITDRGFCSLPVGTRLLNLIVRDVDLGFERLDALQIGGCVLGLGLEPDDICFKALKGLDGFLNMSFGPPHGGELATDLHFCNMLLGFGLHERRFIGPCINGVKEVALMDILVVLDVERRNAS